MTLVFDERANLQGQPSVHALIVGVSAYPSLPNEGEPKTPDSLGLRQLSSTAIAAYKVYSWLVEHRDNLPVKLATCRLLLSPSAAETAIEPALNGLAENASLDNFLKAAKDWRIDANSNPNNMTLFYFAGHGTQRTKDDAVLLLEGFGDGIGGPLRNAVDTNNICNGMASSAKRPKMAQTQLYFIDACRDMLSEFKKIEKPTTTEVFDVELSGEDTRTAPIFYAAVPGTKAIGIKGDQTVFCKVLLDCLKGDAGDLTEIDGQERWNVSVHSLNEALKAKIDEWNTMVTPDAKQDFILGGLVANKPICFLGGPPMVDIVIEVDPSNALTFTKIMVLDETGNRMLQVPPTLDPHPYRSKWPAGVYTISAAIDPPDPRFVNVQGRARPIKPPRFGRKVKVIL